MEYVDVLFCNNEYVLTLTHYLNKQILLDPGSYLAVMCDVDWTPYPYRGVNVLQIAQLDFEEPMTHGDYHICRSGKDTWVTKATTFRQLSSMALSEAQRDTTISKIIAVNDWLWRNASDSARDALGIELSDLSEEERAHLLVRKGVVAYINSSRRFDSAKNYLEEALQVYPSIGHARSTLGKIAIDEGEPDEAIRMFESELAHAEKPDELDAHSYLAVIYGELGQEKAAQKHDDRARFSVSHLAPEVVSSIKFAVASQRARLGAERKANEQDKSQVLTKKDKRWWEFWK